MSGPVRKKVLQPPRLLEFKIPCAFNGQMSDVEVYLGNPEGKHNPIFFQNKFISDVKGGMISPAVLESLDKLKTLALENGVDFLELCKDALSSIAHTNNTLLENQQEAAEVQKLEMTLEEETRLDQNNTNPEEAEEDIEDKELGDKDSPDSRVSDVIAEVVKAAEESNEAENNQLEEVKPEEKPLDSEISEVVNNTNQSDLPMQQEEKEGKTLQDNLKEEIKSNPEAEPDPAVSEVIAKVVQAAEVPNPPEQARTEAEKDSIINPNNEDG
jgi:hypothetical protein